MLAAKCCLAGRQVKLPRNTHIADEKLTKYLLAPKKRNDKSGWLARAGYQFETWAILRRDLLEQILPNDASFLERTPYGDLYEIAGRLEGPNGTVLAVRTVWMIESPTEETKFITLYPDKR